MSCVAVERDDGSIAFLVLDGKGRILGPDATPPASPEEAEPDA